jgi:hypothetical protein
MEFNSEKLAAAAIAACDTHPTPLARVLPFPLVAPLTANVYGTDCQLKLSVCLLAPESARLHFNQALLLQLSTALLSYC